MNLESKREEVDILLGELAVAKRQSEIESNRLKDLKKELRCTEKAQNILQHISQTVQEKVHTRIASVVTRCIQTVFPEEDYSFNIQFERKRGKTEAVLVIKDGSLILTDPMDETSGGVIDVAGVALRLVCLILQKPKLRKIIIMDEPFKNVSLKYQDNVRQMLHTLAEQFGVQFILFSHRDKFKTGDIINLEDYK